MSSNSDLIPDFITALTPMGLRRAMFINNAKAGSMFRYFDIQQYKTPNGKTQWIAWFYRSVDGIGGLNDSTEQ